MIAEDLGCITDSLRQLVRETGFPGMKVLEFAFDSRGTDSVSDYMPHNYPRNCVAYTGTHDNETLVGWLNSITREDRNLMREYLCDQSTPKRELYWCLISLILRSAAKLCIILMQDYLGLDNRGRINIPSTVGTNWLWRLQKGDLTPNLQQRIRHMAALYGRTE